MLAENKTEQEKLTLLAEKQQDEENVLPREEKY